MTDDHLRKADVRLGHLIFTHVLICCMSLVYVASDQAPIAFQPATYHIFFQLSKLPVALAVAGTFSLLALMFVFARFSIGYFVGFSCYSMILGYLWLNCFSDLRYDHRTAALSAAAAAIAFLVPALFVTTPLRQTDVLSERSFDRVLLAIVAIAAAIVAAGAAYNFRLVGLRQIYAYREQLETPIVLRYLLGITATVLLPFAFAGFVARKRYWWCAAVLFALLLLYPINLSKSAFFAPFWLIGLLVLSRILETRAVVVISLLAPTLIGVVLVSVFHDKAAQYFMYVNFRFMAIPSVAMDVYNDFFSRHELTHFCQINLVKRFIDCAYQEPLAVILDRTYDLGNFNASMFATEGIASVGNMFAPISALAGGLIVALANRLSADLSARFVLLSAGVLPQTIINVPLTITLVTHGAVILGMLWFVTPRSIFRGAN
jgi:hypothetical protein